MEIFNENLGRLRDYYQGYRQRPDARRPGNQNLDPLDQTDIDAARARESPLSFDTVAEAIKLRLAQIDNCSKLFNQIGSGARAEQSGIEGYIRRIGDYELYLEIHFF